MFCVGLLLAALVVEQFEDVLEHHVELSFFVPLIMGHGGNTGSQSVTTVIRWGAGCACARGAPSASPTTREGRSQFACGLLDSGMTTPPLNTPLPPPSSLRACRALALRQVSNRDVVKVALKEAGAGCMMGESAVRAANCLQALHTR